MAAELGRGTHGKPTEVGRGSAARGSVTPRWDQVKRHHQRQLQPLSSGGAPGLLGVIKSAGMRGEGAKRWGEGRGGVLEGGRNETWPRDMEELALSPCPSRKKIQVWLSPEEGHLAWPRVFLGSSLQCI